MHSDIVLKLHFFDDLIGPIVELLFPAYHIEWTQLEICFGFGSDPFDPSYFRRLAAYLLSLLSSM